jgi:hypothetical protein
MVVRHHSSTCGSINGLMISRRIGKIQFEDVIVNAMVYGGVLCSEFSAVLES